MSSSECKLPERSQRGYSKSESEPIDVVGRRRRPSWLQEVFSRPVFLDTHNEGSEERYQHYEDETITVHQRMNSSEDGKSSPSSSEPSQTVRPKRSLSASFLSQFSLHDDVHDVMKDRVRWGNHVSRTSEDTLSISSETLSTSAYQGAFSTSLTSSGASSESLASSTNDAFVNRSQSVTSEIVKPPPKRNGSLPMLSSLIGRDVVGTNFSRYMDEGNAEQPDVFDTSEVILFLSQGPK